MHSMAIATVDLGATIFDVVISAVIFDRWSSLQYIKQQPVCHTQIHSYNSFLHAVVIVLRVFDTTYYEHVSGLKRRQHCYWCVVNDEILTNFQQEPSRQIIAQIR